MKTLLLVFGLIIATQNSAIAQDGRIGGVAVNIINGDVTRQNTEAIVVPHFHGEVSWGGVGGAVAAAGGSDGLQLAERYFEAEQGSIRVDFGNAFVTRSQNMGRALINVVSVGSGAEREYAVVQDSVRNALVEAQTVGIKSVSIPVLGTGIIGRLSNDQAAEAILSAVKQFTDAGGRMDEVRIVAFRNPSQVTAFTTSLRSGNFSSSLSPVGEREIDQGRWVRGMRSGGTAVESTAGGATSTEERQVVREAKETTATSGGWRESVREFFGRGRGSRGSK